jgi:hypothetical protein
VDDGSGNSRSTNFTVSVLARPAQLVYLPFEAEAGTITSPMRRYTNSSAVYVSTPSGNQGRVSFKVSIPQSGNYIVWARHISRDSSQDSFAVRANGVTALYATAHGTWSTNWQWTRVNAPSGTTTDDPRVLSLSAGTRTIQFRGREPGCALDRIIVSNDLEFVPGESQSAQALASLAPEPQLGGEAAATRDQIDVVWESTPGAKYIVQRKHADHWQDVSGTIRAESSETGWTDPAPPESVTEYRVILVE